MIIFQVERDYIPKKSVSEIQTEFIWVWTWIIGTYKKIRLYLCHKKAIKMFIQCIKAEHACSQPEIVLFCVQQRKNELATDKEDADKRERRERIGMFF